MRIAGTGKAGTLALVAVIFDPKPRLRLPSGDIPEPKVVHSRSWLPFGIAVWLATVVVGHGLLYGWLSSSNATPSPSATSEAPSLMTPSLSEPQSLAPLANTRALAPLPSAAPIDPEHLPGCEEAARDALTEPGETEALPVDLSRSPFGALLDTRAWTKHCRSAHAVRVHLCVAVKDGQLLGATARTEPDDTSTSRCMIHALSRLGFEPDGTLRKVHVTIDLPSDRGR